MGFLVLAALIGIIPANIAKKKGYSFVAWWMYGALIFIVALPHALCLKEVKPEHEPGYYPHKDGFLRYWDGKVWTSQGGRKCQFCAEVINVEAVVCRYCGRDVPASVAEALRS